MTISIADVNIVPKNLFKTPSLDSPFAERPKSIWVGGTGDLSVIDVSGVTTVFVAIPAGTELHIRPAQINSVGTTATLLVMLF